MAVVVPRERNKRLGEEVEEDLCCGDFVCARLVCQTAHSEREAIAIVENHSAVCERKRHGCLTESSDS